MNTDRKQQALNIRIAAARLSDERTHPTHIANGDEIKFRNKEGQRNHLANFTKGLPHCPNSGLVIDPNAYDQFVKGIDSGDPRDFTDTPLGPDGEAETPTWLSQKAIKAEAKVRAWESQGAGLTFDLEGPDAQAVTMPPAPEVGSDELTAEIAEVYAQALLRDVPFEKITNGSGQILQRPRGPVLGTAKDILHLLNKLPWFQKHYDDKLSPEECNRKRGPLTLQTMFRGITKGDDVGPYISQFLLAGTTGINSNDQEPGRSPDQGVVDYGAVTISHQVRNAKAFDDHMTRWYEWLDVQNGADLRALESYEKSPARRFITTPRDLATYVHYDALYEAYLNACLYLLATGAPFDPGIPFQLADYKDHQQGFAQFGGPHILSLVTEVATRALKAVRYQKFNIHRRFRPEALAARLANNYYLGVAELDEMIDQLSHSHGCKWSILQMIAKKNGDDPNLQKGCNYLLPMAFCEGSPMHPSYGAGHATVAGACVTILKAFFDHGHELNVTGGSNKCRAYVADHASNGTQLKAVSIDQPLTVEGELNKLASNISIGRDWAGVHYFTDYIESIRMGEQIAIGILEEQKLTYGENFSMTVPLFDGGSVRI